MLQKLFINLLFACAAIYPVLAIAQNSQPNQSDQPLNTTLEPQTAVEETAIEQESLSSEYTFYDVEVVLFKHNNAKALNSEYWDVVDDIYALNQENGTNNSDNEIKIDNSDNSSYKNPLAKYLVKARHFISLTQLVKSIDTSELSTQAQHIRYSKDYQLLAHLAWRQPGYDKHSARPMQFVFDQNNQDFTGEIKIILSRYLHAEVDFNLIEQVCRQLDIENTSTTDEAEKVKIEVQLKQAQTSPTSDQDSSRPSPIQNIQTEKAFSQTVCREENIQFRQSRKMRSKQLHYIDHPVFGVLIIINPSMDKAENNG